MQKIKNIIIPLMLFLFIPLTYAINIDYHEVYLEEEFITSKYTNWSFVGSDSCCIDGGYTFQGNVGFANIKLPNEQCGGSCIQQYLRKNDTEIFYNSSNIFPLVMQFNSYVINTADQFTLSFYGRYMTELTWTMQANNLVNPNDFYFNGAYGQIEQCTTLINYGEWDNYTVLFQPDETYDIYQNDILVCDSVLMHGSWYNFTYIQFNSYSDNHDNSSASTNLIFIDNLKIGLGEISADYILECEYPVIFCDNFDYTDSIFSAKNWNVYNSELSLNTNFAPTNYTLFWNNTQPRRISHQSSSFPVIYPIGLNTEVFESYFAPQFSNEFDIEINDTHGYFMFESSDDENDDCINLRFTSNSSHVDIDFFNVSSNSYYNIGNINIKEETTVKIISKFTGTAPDKLNKFYFNTTFENNYADIYIDDELISENNIFNLACDTIWTSEIYKNASAVGSIDNYYFYVGFDKYYNTINDSRINIYVGELVTNVSYEGVTDLGSVLTQDETWCNLGLCSQASRYILSLLILVLISVSVIGASMQYHFEHPLVAVSMIDFFLMIFLVYIGLLPVWIIIVMGLLSLGLAGLYIKAQVT